MNGNKFYIFVADWCPFCRAAKADIFKLIDNYGSNKNIVLFEESMDGAKQKALEQEAFGYPHFVIVDENEKQVNKYPEAPPGQMPDRSYLGLLRFYLDNTNTTPIEEDLIILGQ